MSQPSASLAVACFGGAHIDLIARSDAGIVTASSNPGTVSTALGGVALNVARALAGLDRRVALIGCLGDDAEGGMIHRTLTAEGLDLGHMVRSADFATGRYVAIEGPDGELTVAVSDTGALDNLDADHLSKALQAFDGAALWFADANLPPALLRMIANHADRPRLVVDTVSVTKSRRLGDLIGEIDILFCNTAEAGAMLERPVSSGQAAAKALAEAGARSCVVTDGAGPVGVYDGVQCREIAVPPTAVNSVTGAGDMLIAATIDAVLAGKDLYDAAAIGIAAARRKLTS